MNLLRLLAALLCLAGPMSRAAEEKLTHRITGLCCPEREADLRAAVADRAEVKLVTIDYDRAEATFTYDPKTFSTEQLRLLLSPRGFGFKTTPALPADKLTRIEIGIVGLDCKGCSLGAYHAVIKIAGVERATASFKEGRLVAWIDPEKTNRPALEEALKKARIELRLP